MPAANAVQAGLAANTSRGGDAVVFDNDLQLAIRGREAFLEAGGTDFAYLPCLNDSEDGLAMLRTLVARELAGWTEAS